MNRTQALQEKALDTEQWQKLYYRHQQHYIRKRLDAIKLLKQGNSRFQVCSHQFLGSQQVRKTLNFIFSLVA